MDYLNTASCRIVILTALILAAAFGALSAKVRHRADIQIRDPFIMPVAETKTYYMYDRMAVRLKDGTVRQGVGAYTSKDLENWEDIRPVFHFPDGFWAQRSIWAPEVHRYKGKYYLFATFTSKDKLPTPKGRQQNVKRATQILVSESPDGPFKPFANKPHTPEDWMSLDGTLWVEDGVPYMIFCREWVQVTDGTMELVRLKDDLSDVVGKPKTLFKASDAKWVRSLHFTEGYVTDGCFLHRTKSGRLLMIWSSFGEKGKYMVAIAYSASGKVAGPWKQSDKPLLAVDAGHGMIFKTFDGRLMMTVHQPNSGKIRARLFELKDAGETLAIQREIPLKKPK
jgi:arabinan endo-1,5-alpha-L-arabinosidase